MDTLLSLMNEQLSGIKGISFKNVESFIKDDKRSTEFIRQILNDDEYEEVKESSSIYAIAEARARHSAISFLMGLVFRKFQGFVPQDKFKLWLMISLYHDVAYTSKYITQSDLNYAKEFSPFLLTDDYVEPELYGLRDFSFTAKDVFAYTYEEILAYDRYSRKFHLYKNDIEKVDHGILGGVSTFSKLSRKVVKNNALYELNDIKTICLIIAQHNIYKSDSPKSDKNYSSELDKLKSYSDFKISIDTPLLLFLSLVDTIECVKKFSKSNNQNESQYLQTLTVLKSMKVEISEYEIVIDYSVLKKELALKSGMTETAKKYFNNVKDLGHWTKFTVIEDGNLVKITLN